MKLIKWNPWILKENNNFSYLWKFEPDIIPNSFGEILFEKSKFTKNGWAHWRFVTRWFCSFWLLLFSLLLIAKSWNLHKLHKLTSSFNWYTCIRLHLLWVNSYANEQKCKQWRHNGSTKRRLVGGKGTILGLGDKDPAYCQGWNVVMWLCAVIEENSPTKIQQQHPFPVRCSWLHNVRI